MRWVYILLICCGVFGCENPTTSQLIIPEHIDVQGTARFQAQTEQVFQLLQRRDVDSWQHVRIHIHVIQQGAHSAMWAYEQPPRVEINNRTAFYSVTWYAGVLIHEATHAEFREKSCKDVEQLCIDRQIAVLMRIQAPQHEIQYLQLLDPYYCEINYDYREW